MNNATTIVSNLPGNQQHQPSGFSNFINGVVKTLNGGIDKIHTPKVETEVGVKQESIFLIAGLAILVLLIGKKM